MLETYQDILYAYVLNTVNIKSYIIVCEHYVWES